MKLNRKKSLAVFAAGAAVAMLMAGCSAANPGTSASGSGPVTWNSPTKSLKGVTLTYWTSSEEAHLADQPIAAFDKATGAKINTVIIPDVYETNAPTKLATGAKPDLATWQPTGSELALLKPTTGLQDLSSAPWLSKTTAGIKKIGVVNGKNYAAVVNVPSVIGVYYNKAVFAKAGITSTPTNWDEMIADAQKIMATGVAPFFGAAGTVWPTQWWPQVYVAEAAKAGLWNDVNTGKQTFSSPTLLGAIKEYKSMLDDGLFNSDNKTSTYEESAPALVNGKAGMVLQINSYLQQVQSTTSTAKINSTLGWFPISKDGNIPTSVPGGDNALVAFKTGNATKEAAARQFLTFWLENDYKSYVKAAKVVSLEPSVPSAPGVPAIAKQTATALNTAVGSMQQSAVVNPDFYVYLGDMVAGTKTPAQVASTTQSQFDQLAKALGVKGFQ
jgi:raffinose/stachyose/melibiose transport system substrate-binding protein